MVTIQAIQNGLVKYVDREITPKMQGWKKWTFGAVASMWLGNLPSTFQKIKDTPFVASLGVIGENDAVDIDKLYNELIKQAEKSAVTIDIPMIGSLSINKHDVDTLYLLIQEG
jgi:hypothetical protein